MDKLSTYGYVDKDGKLQVFYRDELIQALKAHMLDTPVEIVVYNKRMKIVDRHRKYYFGVFLDHAVKAYKENGIILFKEELDAFFRSKYLSYQTIESGTDNWNTEIRSLGEHSDVTIDEFKEFIEICISEVVENTGYNIPFMGEYSTNFLNQ